MKRIVSFVLVAMIGISACAQKLKVAVETPGTLSAQLSGAEGVESIVVSGSIDVSDLLALRGLPKLRKVDMRKVKNIIIGDSAFFGMKQLESVRLPKYLQKIGRSAFEGCESLKYVECPGYLEELPERMFCGCVSLDRLDILNSRITRIGTAALMNSGIGLIPLPKMLTTIGNFAFAGCEKIEMIHIPMWVGTIGQRAFANCKRLRGIVLRMDTPPVCAADAFVGIEACTLYVRHPEFFRDREPWSTINMSYDNYNGDELRSFDQSDIRDLKQNLKR